MLQHLKAWWATHVTLIAAVVGFFDPSIQQWMAQHQQAALLIGGAWSLLLHHLQPPRNFGNGDPQTGSKFGSIGSLLVLCFLFLGLLAFPSAALAQNPLPDRAPETLPDAPTPKIQRFVVSGTATSNGGSSHAVMMAAAGFQLFTNPEGSAVPIRASVSYSQIWNPDDASDLKWKMGDFNGSYLLSDLIPSRFQKNLAFDPGNYLVTFQGSAGKVTGIDPRTGQHVNHIAEGLGIYGSRPFNDHGQLTCGMRFLHGVNGATWVKVPAAGFNWTF